MEQDLLYLNGTGTFKQVEESLRCLGQYFGFDSSRPDNEYGTGPDLLWIMPGDVALCIDAKTDKEPTSVYRKEELGQLSDHVQWVRDHHSISQIIPGFVGFELPFSPSANPPEGVKVASLAKFQALGEALKLAYQNIAASALPLTIQATVNEEFGKRSLLWPQLETTIQFIELRSLRPN
jgi:hypothetical protein